MANKSKVCGRRTHVLLRYTLLYTPLYHVWHLAVRDTQLSALVLNNLIAIENTHSATNFMKNNRTFFGDEMLLHGARIAEKYVFIRNNSRMQDLVLDQFWRQIQNLRKVDIFEEWFSLFFDYYMSFQSVEKPALHRMFKIAWKSVFLHFGNFWGNFEKLRKRSTKTSNFVVIPNLASKLICNWQSQKERNDIKKAEVNFAVCRLKNKNQVRHNFSHITDPDPSVGSFPT